MEFCHRKQRAQFEARSRKVLWASGSVVDHAQHRRDLGFVVAQLPGRPPSPDRFWANRLRTSRSTRGSRIALAGPERSDEQHRLFSVGAAVEVVVFIPAVPDARIRTAVEKDIASVLHLWGLVGSPPRITDTREGLLALLVTNQGALLIAEHDGELVGSLIAAWDGWRGSLYRLAVHPDRRRKGIATALLREGERRLRAQGALMLTAIVAESNQDATGFWQAAGYTRQGDRTRFVSEPMGQSGDLEPASWLMQIES